MVGSSMCGVVLGKVKGRERYSPLGPPPPFLVDGQTVLRKHASNGVGAFGTRPTLKLFFSEAATA